MTNRNPNAANGAGKIANLNITTKNAVSGQVLVHDGSRFSPNDIANAGLTLIKTQAINGGVASVTVSNAFSYNYDSYLITVSGGYCSGDYGINMRLGSTTTGYYYSGLYLTYGNSNPWNLAGNNAAEWGGVGIATTSTTSAKIFVNNPYMAKHTYFDCDYTYGHPGGGHAACGGYLANSTQYTSFTLFVNAGGAFYGGPVIRVYGYRNSI